MNEHLLIDVKNLLYRVAFTSESDLEFKKSGHHPINIALHLLGYYNRNFSPNNIHIFWDCDRNDIWRKKLLPTYKESREPSIKFGNMSSKIEELSSICIKLFCNMGFRQYYKSHMEADDLIYAFCISEKSSMVIVSGDSDLKQIIYRYDNVKLHNPFSRNKIEEKPMHDPVVLKSLIGDKTDNIDGYHMVGKVTAAELCESSDKMSEFFKSPKAVVKDGDNKLLVGQNRFNENVKIIDLSQCDWLQDNIDYINKIKLKPVKFDIKTIKELIIKCKLRGVLADISKNIAPFKRLTEHGS